MKKLPFLALIVLFSMCKSASHVATKPPKELTVDERIEKIKEEDRLPEEDDVMDLPDYAQVRDDFRSVTDKTKANYLRGMNASADNYSVVILTKGFKGENISIKGNSKTYYYAMTMSDLRSGIAKSIRVDNTQNIVLKDSYTGGSLTIESDHAKMFKFIYVMKNNANKETPFKVTFSNTLRPVR
ncbi:hypothetical protein HX045_04315 [Myroides odoratimimus]|uniref:Uncharacterized protein n=3 Tax=Myroides odoratimimus TaxID=76832 RepID=A0A0S7EAS6_9FLAO|nr:MULTISPECIES: hypothetical protein [Myroides]AJA68727.1 hypothetical protein MYRA21_1574 [Myroides sp. A21]ALU25989.1 hypothetical protein AS202_07460 [Myroides odoratimimus]APA92035.1 hypothetical protein BK054_07335 [Myroides sp. ZB35]EHO11118.1 hypothetical protein HMPREF9712_00775 [Myroides odoratimimus CCUG 10230]EHO14241.1 hypothetical protein HMPREF9714_00503 [Myroides odoratimimus CCUG 12901]